MFGSRSSAVPWLERLLLRLGPHATVIESTGRASTPLPVVPTAARRVLRPLPALTGSAASLRRWTQPLRAPLRTPAAGTDGRSRRARHRGSRALAGLVEWVAVVVGALVVALVIKTFLIQAFYIPSASMEPTLDVGDRVLVNRLSYDLHDVNRGDIVVFERPEADSEARPEDLIKRVIGLPGETVEARDGQVLRRRPGPRRALPARRRPPPATSSRSEIPDGHVFVMGDNRADSRDSRFFGPIDEDHIVGRAFVRVWPLTNLGGL